MTPDFVHLQRTNGNNYLMASIVKRQKIWTQPRVQVSAIHKAGGGALISYTISTILGNHDKGYFHCHGWVAAASTGVRIDLFKCFFLQGDRQSACARYTNTKLGADHQGLAAHHFLSWQGMYSQGVPAGTYGLTLRGLQTPTEVGLMFGA